MPMIGRNRKFITTYILLVGLPILILTEVLRSGRNLTAPLSIQGVWKIQNDMPGIASLLCLPYAAGQQIAMSISQSGKAIELTMGQNPAAHARAILEGNRITAFPLRSGTLEGCSSLPLNLTANIDPTANPRSITGTITAPGCPSCSPVVLKAIQQPATKQ